MPVAADHRPRTTGRPLSRALPPASRTFASDDRPPRSARPSWLAAAGALVLGSAPLLALNGTPWHVLGYVLAAPAPFLPIVLRRRTLVRRREEHGFVEGAPAELASIALLVIGMALALSHAFLFAYDIASR